MRADADGLGAGDELSDRPLQGAPVAHAQGQRAREIFELTADEPADEWPRIVDHAANGDLALAAKVMRLLHAMQADRFHLDQPHLTFDDPENSPEAGADIGRIVSRYKLVRLIGYGGMGAVYEGVRADDEYEQRVAVKLIRQGLVAPGMATRFRRERQILAALEHRNIARLLDGGSTEKGEPFFVMEFIEGAPLIRYCDEAHLSIEHRLRLFLQVCGAVSHAHGKLVVHCDLKPANMLVTSDGSVKLLDFGVAKLLGAQDGSTASAGLETVTQLGHPLTPEYASPEQLREEPASTASDVYSLGVVLYELVAGRRPFTFSSRSPVAALRALESNAPRPSVVATPEAAVAAGEPSLGRLRNKLSGELDNVILKAIRGEPERRYVSVDDLARDLHCYLDGLPVSAQPDSALYRTKKFVRRHASAVLAGVVAVLALLAGTTVSTVQARRAETSNRRSTRINSFLQTMLSQPDARRLAPPGNTHAVMTISELLDGAAARATTDLNDDPAVQSAVTHTIGKTYIAIGRYDAGVAQLSRALAIDRRNAASPLPTIATDILDLGEAELERGNNAAADTLFRNVLAICGADGAAADSAVVCVTSLGDLGGATWFENKLPESEELLRRAVAAYSRKYGPVTVRTAIAVGNLGGVLDSRGKLLEAQKYYRQALAIYSAVGGNALPQRAFTLTNLATSLNEQGHPEAAVPLVREAIDVISRSESPDHPDAALAWVQLGALNRELGNISLARAQTTRGLTILASAGPIARRLFVQAQTWSALMLLAEHQPRDARAVLTRALDTASVEFKPDDPRLADVQAVLGEDMLALHMRAAAESLLVTSHATMAAALGANHPRTLHVLRDLSLSRGDSTSRVDPANATAPRSSRIER